MNEGFSVAGITPCLTGAIVGIDPGLTGAIAYYYPAHPKLIRVDDLPRVGDVIDAGQLAGWLAQMKPDFAFMERPGSMPNDGHSQAFKFGRASGAIEGVLGALGIRHALVRPSTWKKDLRLPADKEAAREMAIRLWPDIHDSYEGRIGIRQRGLFDRKLDHNRAEAALIAFWGSRQTFPAGMPASPEVVPEAAE
jgi:hypothetical protein